MPTEETFIKGMYKLAAGWPEFNLPEATIELYRERLAHLSDHEFERAVNHCIDNCQFFPRVKGLLEASRPLFPSPIEAWNRLLLAAAGSGVEPPMDAATKKAMNFIGGWNAICYNPTDQHPFMFARFKEAYLEAQEQEQRQQIGQAAVPQLEKDDD